MLDDFHRNGYVVLPGVIGSDELEDLRAEADRIIELLVNSSIFHRRRNPRLHGSFPGDGRLAVRQVQPVNDLSPAIASLSGDDRLTGPMAELLGTEPVLMEEKLNYKQMLDTRDIDLAFLATSRGMTGDAFYLHHDWGFYKAQGFPVETLSSAVALDDCAGKGPIRVFPGSHLLDPPLLNPAAPMGDGAVDPAYFRGTAPVPLDLTAGSVLLFHSKLVHDSEPNPTDAPRRLMIYSHYPRRHDDDGDADRRNGALRDRSQQFEAAYRDAIGSGAFTDVFRMGRSVVPES